MHARFVSPDFLVAGKRVFLPEKLSFLSNQKNQRRSVPVASMHGLIVFTKGLYCSLKRLKRHKNKANTQGFATLTAETMIAP
jgi:hypothetical protein